MSTESDTSIKNNNLSSYESKIFKDTFQKPSQIYKYLGNVWRKNPLYLNRTLSYISKHRHRPSKPRQSNIDSIALQLYKNKATTTTNSTHTNRKKGIDTGNGQGRSKTKNYCYYDWICSDSVRTSQKTKSKGFICAWCDIDLHRLDCLMMHLKSCHSRFNFDFNEYKGYPSVEMTLNPDFDGSYCGFKYPGHDLKRDFKFRPNCPERRMSTTQIIYFRAKRKFVHKKSSTKMRASSQDMFNYDEDDVDVDVCSGRLYYHTSTCLPVKPNEVDLDSEADMDPEWLRERTQLMIDEFTDVNEGEKELLKLWNVHIMKNYKYKGDNMIRQACLDFVDLEGHAILSKNLYYNLTLHLANLYDYGLIGSRDLLDCIRRLKKLRPPASNTPSTRTTGKRSLERNSNEHCQRTPAKRALTNSHVN